VKVSVFALKDFTVRFSFTLNTGASTSISTFQLTGLEISTPLVDFIFRVLFGLLITGLKLSGKLNVFAGVGGV